MIYSAALTLLSMIGGLLALMQVKDIIWLIKSISYIKQGMPIRYFPFIGYAKYIDNPHKEEGLEDFLKMFQKPGKSAKKETERLIMINGLTTDPTIFLNDKDLIREFFAKETEVCCMENTLDFPPKDAFLFSIDPHRVQNDRAIFAEIFYPDKINKQIPQIKAIVKRHLNRIKKEVKKVKNSGVSGNKKTQIEIELKPYIKDILTDVVSFAIFGGEIPEVEGVTLASQMEFTLNGFYKNRTSFLHIATGGLYSKFGIDPNYNEVLRVYHKIIKKLKEVIRSRENLTNYEFGNNAVDLLILKKRDLEAQGRSDQMMNYEQLAQNIFSIIFAGTDTTRSFTESILYKLSLEPKLQRELRDCIRKQISGQAQGEDSTFFEGSEFFQDFLRESLRLYSPASMSFHRKILKRFSLGPYTINKGDYLILPYIALQSKPEYFGEGRKFNLKKYEEKKQIKELSKSVLIPFSSGKRACIGKNLADVMVKIILFNFLDQFEMARSSEPNRRFQAMTVGFEHCKVLLTSLK